jgi:intracellular sulfur oxidation DsrE/DsrF family protein
LHLDLFEQPEGRRVCAIGPIEAREGENMAQPVRGRVLVLGSEGMGRGDDELGRTILANFLKSLVAKPLRPDKIVCWNAGVKLLAADSPTVGVLQDLEGIGVEILVCKTCVEHFGLQGSLRAGEVATMPIISDLLLRSDVLTV